jgi:hypothetical protein
MGEERKVYKVLVGKPEGKRPLGRPRPSILGRLAGVLSGFNWIGGGGVAGGCEYGDELSVSGAMDLVAGYNLCFLCGRIKCYYKNFCCRGLM